MLRALSVGLLAFLVAAFVVAENPVVQGMEQVQAGAVAQMSECADGFSSGACSGMCAACVAFAADAVVTHTSHIFDRLQSTPASRFTDVARPPEAAPPKHLLA